MPEIADKRAALTERPSNFENHLFFQARNLAIEAVLLRLENRLLREGFQAKCLWNEASNLKPTVEIRMYNPKKGGWEYATCRVHLNRERIAGREEVSDCFYSLNTVATTEYWPHKQPQYLLNFRQLVADLEKSGYLAAEIAKVNYPFDYEHFSSF